MSDGAAGAANTALVDASSAILLHRAGLFATVTAAYRVVMAASVYTEVTAPGHHGAVAFGRFYREGRFVLERPAQAGISDEGLPGGLHAGERDTLLLYRGGCGDFIVIDDGKAAAHCRDAGIPYLNALLMPRVLHLSGCLSAEAGARAAKTITDAGRYADWVVRYAREAAEAVLTPFLPAGPVDFSR
ncbi:MAG: hypothetical protein ABIL58_13000 [Pseudomonadota bacterium]